MEQSNWIKAYIVDVLPCMAVLLYTLAIVYNVGLFSVFDLDITSYLSLSETLIGVIEPILSFAIATAIALWVTSYFTNTLFPIMYYNVTKKHKKQNYKVLRFFIRIKLNDVRRRWKKFFEKDKKKDEEIRKDVPYYNDNYLTFAAFAVLFGTFIGIHDGEQQAELIEIGMGRAFYGLFIPIAIVLFLFMIMQFVFMDIKIVGILKNFKKSDLLKVIVLYYIFAIVVFYDCGLQQGKQIIYNNKVEFSIKMSDGSTYDNYQYSYIKHINDKVFLFNKNTRKNLILNNEAIVAIQIHGDNSKQSIIRYFIDSNKNRYHSVVNFIKYVEDVLNLPK